MTDSEHAAVLRLWYDTMVWSNSPVALGRMAAVKRAIELLEKSAHETAQHLADRYPSSRTGLRP